MAEREVESSCGDLLPCANKFAINSTHWPWKNAGMVLKAGAVLHLCPASSEKQAMTVYIKLQVHVGQVFGNNSDLRYN